MINASMTAYSTAVGPSSCFRKRTTFCTNRFMAVLRGSRSARGPELCGRCVQPPRHENPREPVRPAPSGRTGRSGKSAKGVPDKPVVLDVRGPETTPPRPIGRGGQSYRQQVAQLAPPAGAAFRATLENVLLAFEPRVVTAVLRTTIMRANITAYSTAVGPSSFFMNSTNFLVRFRISLLPWGCEDSDEEPCRSPCSPGTTITVVTTGM